MWRFTRGTSVKRSIAAPVACTPMACCMVPGRWRLCRAAGTLAAHLLPSYSIIQPLHGCSCGSWVSNQYRQDMALCGLLLYR
jgi:hypothetical protein